MYPSIFGENLFDDFFNDPFGMMASQGESPLFGKHAKNMMKTDVRETESAYELDIDLPGFKKDEISIDLKNGYLTIGATKGLDKDEQDKNKALQAVNSSLTVDNQIMKPKADYFDELVDRNLLTNFRETAKQLQVKEKEFIRFLLEKKFIYRDKRGKIQPYADKNNGLFEVKEFSNEKTGFASTQTLITPKGRETFRLLFLKASA